MSKGTRSKQWVNYSPYLEQTKDKIPIIALPKIGCQNAIYTVVYTK